MKTQIFLQISGAKFREIALPQFVQDFLEILP